MCYIYSIKNISSHSLYFVYSSWNVLYYLRIILETVLQTSSLQCGFLLPETHHSLRSE